MPRDSGPVSHVACMPNNRHLICASYDNIRLWDMEQPPETQVNTGATMTPQRSGVSTPSMMVDGVEADGLPTLNGLNGKLLETKDGEEDPFAAPVVPFVIVPGHHGGVISSLVIDASKRYMISASGTRGWEGVSTNVCLFYEINPVMQIRERSRWIDLLTAQYFVDSTIFEFVVVISLFLHHVG
ncbi:Transcription factor spt8, partial [Borealophlyctis nickersoniae]